MESVFQAINNVFSFVIPISDFLWDFPTNCNWYASIPILGNFSLAVILLVATGIFFSIKTKFIQVTHFKEGLKILTKKKSDEMGISSLGAFFLSSAMRVGPGNILGVTGAISIGGPGALFWMWVSAFFGMATAYMEATLSQIFKEKKDDDFVGGLPYYGQRLLGNRAWAGIMLSVMFIVYAMCCLPAQGYNVVSSVGQMGEMILGRNIPTESLFYYVTAIILIIVTTYIAFGGIKKVTKFTNAAVPIMAVIYVMTVLVLIAMNLKEVPYFFKAVFTQAFTAEAVFGGTFGTVLVQGIKRGLMSNEAGQGTISMAAGAANTEHPCEQGCVQAIGVFLDTIVICTLTGFVVVMAHLWNGPNANAWFGLDKLPKYLTSASALTPGDGIFNAIIIFLITISFCLFAFTSLIGFFSFSEIAATRITKKKAFINTIRIIGICITVFGILSSMAGIDLGNLWAISDLGNILIVFANVPILYIGFKYASKATVHFKKKDGTKFTSDIIGTKCKYWDERAQ